MENPCEPDVLAGSGAIDGGSERAGVRGRTAELRTRRIENGFA